MTRIQPSTARLALKTSAKQRDGATWPFLAVAIGLLDGGQAMAATLPVATGESAAPTVTRARAENVTVRGASTDSNRQALAKQKVAVANTVITQDQLKQLQIENLDSAQKLVPSLQETYVNPQSLVYNIRGFGNATNTVLAGVYNGTNINVDGVYLPRSVQWVSDVAGLESIDVLRGPQGTSGGFDSIGGVVDITTTPPGFKPTAGASVSYGSYNFLEEKANVGGPIGHSGKLAYNIYAFNSDRDGFIKDTSPHLPGGDLLATHDRGIRVGLLYIPSDRLTIRLSADYDHTMNTCCVYLYDGAVTQHTNGTPITNNAYAAAARVGYTLPASGQERKDYTTDAAAGGTINEALETYGTSANIKYDLGDGSTLSSVTAARGYDFHGAWHNGIVVGVDTNAQYDAVPTVRSLQEELKISSPAGKRIVVSAGVFSFFERYADRGSIQYGSQAGGWFGSPTKSAAYNALAYNYAGAGSKFLVNTYDAAPFVQALAHLTSKLTLTTGVRYSYTVRTGYSLGTIYGESVAGVPAAQQQAILATRYALYGSSKASWNYKTSSNQGLPSGLVSLSYNFDPDIMGYATYARGARPGGINVNSSPVPAGAATVVKPESIDDYEVGLKDLLLGGRLQLNGALFWERDHNYITNVEDITAAGTALAFLANANEATSRGAEFDLRYHPIKALMLYASGTYDDAFFNSFPSGPCPYEVTGQTSCDYDGKKLSLISTWTFAGGVEYQRTLGLSVPYLHRLVGYVGGDETYRSNFFAASTDSLYSVIHGYPLTNVHAGVRTQGGGWDLSFWVHNLFDRHYFTVLSDASQVGDGVIAGAPGDPLMLGGTLAARF